jgi:microcystin-dependent protein
MAQSLQEGEMRRGWLLLLLAGVLAMVPAASAQTRFLGSIALVPYNFAPLGTAFCDGSLLPINENSALFNLIGTTYGGDGQTTFALPDLRGRMAIGQDQGPGLTPRVIGQNGGEETVTLTVGQIAAHNHLAMANTQVGNTVSPASAYWAAGPRVLLYSAPSSLVQMNVGAVGNSAGSQPHHNLKPFLVLNYVIWLQGIFPSQG